MNPRDLEAIQRMTNPQARLFTRWLVERNIGLGTAMGYANAACALYGETQGDLDKMLEWLRKKPSQTARYRYTSSWEWFRRFTLEIERKPLPYLPKLDTNGKPRSTGARKTRGGEWDRAREEASKARKDQGVADWQSLVWAFSRESGFGASILAAAKWRNLAVVEGSMVFNPITAKRSPRVLSGRAEALALALKRLGYGDDPYPSDAFLAIPAAGSTRPTPATQRQIQRALTEVPVKGEDVAMQARDAAMTRYAPELLARFSYAPPSLPAPVAPISVATLAPAKPQPQPETPAPAKAADDLAGKTIIGHFPWGDVEVPLDPMARLPTDTRTAELAPGFRPGDEKISHKGSGKAVKIAGSDSYANKAVADALAPMREAAEYVEKRGLVAKAREPKKCAEATAEEKAAAAERLRQVTAQQGERMLTRQEADDEFLAFLGDMNVAMAPRKKGTRDDEGDGNGDEGPDGAAPGRDPGEDGSGHGDSGRAEADPIDAGTPAAD